MKKIVTYFLLLAAQSHPASSQFNIRNGAQITTSGAPSLVLQNMNLVNSGSLSAGTGSIRMTGNVMTQIQGNGPLNLHDLVINNSAGVTLQRNITVGNHLELNGTLFEKNNTITLGNNAAIINETGINRLTDDPAGTGNATTTRVFPAPLINENPAYLGVEFVAAPALGSTTITRYGAAFVLNGNSNGLLQRYYHIQPANNSGLGASIRLYYLDAELNGVDENTAVIWKSSNMGQSWTQLQPDARNTALNYVQKNNLDELAMFTIGSSLSVLPVFFSSFNVQCKETGARLVWSTSYERDADQFIIEKSTDAVNWKEIGVIPANGTASGYQFADKTAGKAWYRLKQTDNNGSVHYSTILQSDCAVEKITLLVYPNPAKDYTDLRLDADAAFASPVLLINSSGQLVRQVPVNFLQGQNTIRINLAGLPAGSYIVRLHHGNTNLSKQIIKQ